MTEERLAEIRAYKFVGEKSGIATELIAEVDQLRDRLEQINCLFDEATKHVIPGECDSPEAFRKLLVELKAENATLRHEFKMAQASMPEVQRLRDQVTHYDELFSKSVVVPTEEYIQNVKLREALEYISWPKGFFMEDSWSVANSMLKKAREALGG